MKQRTCSVCRPTQSICNQCEVIIANVDFIFSFDVRFDWSRSRDADVKNQFTFNRVKESVCVCAHFCTLDPLPNQSNKYLRKQIFSFRPAAAWFPFASLPLPAALPLFTESRLFYALECAQPNNFNFEYRGFSSFLHFFIRSLIKCVEVRQREWVCKDR